MSRTNGMLVMGGAEEQPLPAGSIAADIHQRQIRASGRLASGRRRKACPVNNGRALLNRHARVCRAYLLQVKRLADIGMLYLLLTPTPPPWAGCWPAVLPPPAEYRRDTSCRTGDEAWKCPKPDAGLFSGASKPLNARIPGVNRAWTSLTIRRNQSKSFSPWHIPTCRSVVQRHLCNNRTEQHARWHFYGWTG